jgi:hypothetical protein
MDRWINNYAAGHITLITSIDVPAEYMRLYNHEVYDEVFKIFKKLKRWDMNVLVPYLGRFLIEIIEECNVNIDGKVKEEKKGVICRWNGIRELVGRPGNRRKLEIGLIATLSDWACSSGRGWIWRASPIMTGNLAL